MTLIHKPILREGVAQVSYFLADDDKGIAAIVDPSPDVEVYLKMARHYSVSITHIFETHIHADFLSGSRALLNSLAGGAKIYVSGEGDAEYDFAHEKVYDSNVFNFGKLKIEARHTPGHTPEHLSFLLYSNEQPQSPWGILTGDSFFVDSVGRPDLLGEEKTEQLVRDLFNTLQNFYSKLDDSVIIYPGHAAGSACGPQIGDRLQTSIGYEKQHNKYLKIRDKKQFQEKLQSQAPPVPHHYSRLKMLNASGDSGYFEKPMTKALLPEQLKKLIENEEVQILDTRDMLAFGGGFITGSLNIGMRPELSLWAGWLLDQEKPIALILKNDEDLDLVIELLWRTSFTNLAGYLVGGISNWREQGMPLQHLPQMDVHQLQKEREELTIIDVRKPEEWQGGHIPQAKHFFLGNLFENLAELSEYKNKPVATYCATGFRASIAASLLAANGFTNVRNVPGSWKAWRAAAYETTKP